MPIPAKYLAEFDEDRIYHVYNRTNNKEPLFLSDENRYFFLSKYHEYISPLAHTLCWCLLPNHFHLLIRIRTRSQIISSLLGTADRGQTMIEKRYLDNIITTGVFTEQRFKRFFQSYSLAFNKMYNRNGNLFYKPFKRVLVDRESQFTQAIVYIHANPVKHRLVPDFENYQWSSWKTLLSDKPTSLSRQEIIDWFGNRDNMIRDHRGLTNYYYTNDISIED